MTIPAYRKDIVFHEPIGLVGGQGPSSGPQFVPPERVEVVEPAGLYRRYGPPDVAEHRRRLAAGRYTRLKDGFDHVKALIIEGKSLTDVTRTTGFTCALSANGAGWPAFDHGQAWFRVNNAERLPRLSGEALERGLHDRAAVVRGDALA